jgi:hypothetical protein
MVTAQIVINQVGKPLNVLGQSRDDLALGVMVTLSNENNSGVYAWNWRILAKSVGSTTSLTTPTSSVCTFVPDVAGSYLIQLLLNGRTVATAIAAVKTSYLGLRIPVRGETDELSGWDVAMSTLVNSLETAISTGGGSLPHHINHQNGGSDEVNVAGLDGYLNQPQNADKLQNRAISASVPSDNDSLVWNASLARWRPKSIVVHNTNHQNGGSDEISVTGLDGYLNQPQNADKLQNRAISASAPSDNDSLVWNSTLARWRPKSIVVHNTNHQNGGSDEISVEGLDGYLNQPQDADRIRSRIVADTAPADGYVLIWNASANRWIPGAQTGSSGGDLDRTLVFSDDTQLTEPGGNFVTKKTFRIVRDPNKIPSSWRFVVSLWGTDPNDTAECKINAVGTGGTDTVTLSTVFGSTETIVSGNIVINDINEPNNSFVTIQIQLRLSAGATGANIKYTDMYALYTASPEV